MLELNIHYIHELKKLIYLITNIFVIINDIYSKIIFTSIRNSLDLNFHALTTMDRFLHLL